MAKITKKCPVCGRLAEITSETKIGTLTIANYGCGHIRAYSETTPKDLDLTSKDGKKPFKYQLEGASWGLKNSPTRVLFADEMGVGKTLQAQLIVNSDLDEFSPVLVICKAKLRTQIAKEFYRWTGLLCQIIEQADEFILPGIKVYIIAYDLLAYQEFTTKRGKTITKGIKEPEEWIQKINPRTIILDECQSVKNTKASRTQSVQKLAKVPEHLIALSGTPIMNHAGEYFPILNMLQPERFPSQVKFVSRWCDSYISNKSGTLKIGGIKEPEKFKEYTKDFIIRRTRKEVLPDLPSVDRRFRFEELGAAVEEAYKEEFKKFQEYYMYSGDNSSFSAMNNIMAYLSKMRHLTGIAKIPGVVEFVEEFLDETDRKIVIFTHHIDVAKEIIGRIRQFYPNALHMDDFENVDKFWTNDYRVLQLSTLSGGEGINLQCCSDCIQMEPEWSPLKEEQAEGRFPRPGQLSDKITATSFIAVGTVDEFFSELKEQKRANFASTMDGVKINWNEAALMKELAEILATRGGKRWGW